MYYGESECRHIIDSVALKSESVTACNSDEKTYSVNDPFDGLVYVSEAIDLVDMGLLYCMRIIHFGIPLLADDEAIATLSMATWAMTLV